jgi:hypothetical protein
LEYWTILASSTLQYERKIVESFVRAFQSRAQILYCI